MVLLNMCKMTPTIKGYSLARRKEGSINVFSGWSVPINVNKKCYFLYCFFVGSNGLNRIL